jgi:hypothetical protein
LFNPKKRRSWIILLLPSISPINAPTVKHKVKLVTMMNTSPFSWAISVMAPESVMAAQIMKPIIEAPAKINVARLLIERFEGVVRMKPMTAMRTTIVTVRKATCPTLRLIITPKTADTIVNSTVKNTQ